MSVMKQDVVDIRRLSTYDTPRIQHFLTVLSRIYPEVVYQTDQTLVCDLYNPADGTLSLDILDCSSLDSYALDAFNAVRCLEGELVIASRA